MSEIDDKLKADARLIEVARSTIGDRFGVTRATVCDALALSNAMVVALLADNHVEWCESASGCDCAEVGEAALARAMKKVKP